MGSLISTLFIQSLFYNCQFELYLTIKYLHKFNFIRDIHFWFFLQWFDFFFVTNCWKWQPFLTSLNLYINALHEYISWEDKRAKNASRYITIRWRRKDIIMIEGHLRFLQFCLYSGQVHSMLEQILWKFLSLK